MLKIKDKSVTPPGYWTFRESDGTVLRGGDFGNLVNEVMRYRIKMGMPTANLADEVEDGICRQKDIQCRPADPAPAGEARSITVADVWRFLQTIGEWVKDARFEEQAEAERRAEICAGCFANVPVDTHCWGCTGVFALVHNVIGDRKTRMDESLKNCAVCGCLNGVAVFVPLPVLLKASGDLEYPEDTGQKDGDGNPIPCWKRVEK